MAYLHEATGTALCGDVAGVRIGDGPLIAPTPPPDIDVDAWHTSIDLVAGWRPERLALTHFGSFADAADHLARLHDELDEAVRRARELDGAAYAAWVAQRVRASAEAPAYEQAAPPPTLHPGLERWLHTH